MCRGANETEANPLSRENTTGGVREIKEATLSRYDTMRGANETEANPLPRENTTGGVRELEEAAYERTRKNLHQHAALRHFADGRKLNGQNRKDRKTRSRG